MSQLSAYITLLRPRTLPLALSVMMVGNALAYQAGAFRLSIGILSLLTALALQILSNIANDYGDALRGADHYRAPDAPIRATANDLLYPKQVRFAIAIAVVSCMGLGLFLLMESLESRAQWLWFLLCGALSIFAALGYTLGRYAYGYYALGEVAVFVFFGLLGVLGSNVLHTHTLASSALLPACASGLLAATVLHVNNLRDIESDLIAGKQTLATKLGMARGKHFQTVLCLVALLCYTLYALWIAPSAWLVWLASPWLIRHCLRVQHAQTPAEIGQELVQIVRLNAMVSTLFVLGVVTFR